MSAFCRAKLRDLRYRQLLRQVFTANSHWRTSFLAVLLVSGSRQLLGGWRELFSDSDAASPTPHLLSLLSPIQTSYLSLPDLQTYLLTPCTWRGKTWSHPWSPSSLFGQLCERYSTMIFFFSPPLIFPLQSSWKIKRLITMIRTTTFFVLFVYHLDIMSRLHLISAGWKCWRNDQYFRIVYLLYTLSWLWLFLLHNCLLVHIWIRTWSPWGWVPVS